MSAALERHISNEDLRAVAKLVSEGRSVPAILVGAVLARLERAEEDLSRRSAPDGEPLRLARGFA
ncbi:hypothetical protein [Allosphingosinicella deserti]|uniref:hypothetical protein n=1 Tax=Allosphingosinicella deserti TaxID=2116704 RepID=UPI001304DBA6|nr:hypothetical protein [Sphingomonas deserti]